MNQSLLGWPINTDGIQKILDFANADLSDPDAVSRLNFDGEHWVGPTTYEIVTSWAPVKGVSIAGPMRPKKLDCEDEIHQKKLRNLLDEIIEGGKCTDDVHAQLTQELFNVHQCAFIADSKFLYFQPIVKTVREWYCLGVAALGRTNLDKRLHLCHLAGCQTYFIDWPGRRGHAGKAQRYCCKNHGNIDRSRRHRKRKKREKAARGISI